MSPISSKDDVRPFAGEWVAVLSNNNSISDQRSGELHYMVGKLGKSDKDPEFGEAAFNLQRIAEKGPAYCALTRDIIADEVALCNPSNDYIPHVLKMRLLTKEEIAEIKAFMNRLYPVHSPAIRFAPLGQFGWLSTSQGFVGRGDVIFSSELHYYNIKLYNL